MADSIRERAMQDVVTLLNTARPAGVPEAKRSYGLSISLNNMPFIAVYRAGRESHDDVGGKFGPIKKRSFQIKIDCWDKSDPADPTAYPDKKTDVLTKWVIKALEGQSKGINDGALYHRIVVEGSEIDYDQKDYLFTRESVVVTVEYQSRTGDLETWA